MTFNSISEIQSYLRGKIQASVAMAQEQIFQIIDKFIKEYYAEFSPEMYQRTYQLYRSLVKSEVRMTANGAEAEVYFDLDRLDYAIKRINGKTIHNKGWSEEKTLTAAAHGSHGGKESGTAIWDAPMEILNRGAYDRLKRCLIANGVPVR